MSDALDKIDRHMDELRDLISRIEDDAVHRAAEEIRTEARGWEEQAPTQDRHDPYMKTAAVMYQTAHSIDPYEERDGQLIRKYDDKPVTWLSERGQKADMGG